MIKHSHWKGQRLTLQRKTNNDKVKQNLVEFSLFIWGPGVFWPILWAATLPYFCSQRNVCMNLSACRNLICRRDKRNYALRFKSWRGVQTLVSLRLMGVNISLSRLDPITDLSSKPWKSLVDGVTFQQEGAGCTALHCLAAEGLSSARSLVSHNENVDSAVQSAASTKSLDATRGLLTATVQDGGGRGQIPLHVYRASRLCTVN